MGFQDFLKKLLGSEKQPKPSLPGEKFPHYEDQTGFYNVRGEAFERAYVEWCTAKIFPQKLALALSPDDIVDKLDNRSGYVREFCLRALMLHDYSDALKPVVRRLNDYVPINRNLATQISLAWLEAITLDELVDALPDLVATTNQSRAKHELVHAVVDGRFETEEGRSALENGLLHSHAKVRRECWKLCLKKFTWTSSERIAIAMRCRDPAISRSAEQDVYALEDVALMDWFSKMHVVQAMPLRRAILVALHRKNLIDTLALICYAIWDDSFSIRWLAQHWSKDKPELIIQQYLQALDSDCSPRRKRYALEGLAALKSTGSIKACEGAMVDKHPVVRKAAFVAVCQLDADNQARYIAEALQDVELMIVCQALRQMTSSGEPLPEEVLQRVAVARKDELEFFVRLLAFASQMSIWPALHLASFTSYASTSVKSQLQSYVEHFLHRLPLTNIYIAPTQKQWAAISIWYGFTALSPQSVLRQVLEAHAK
jgi:hypothetical protein